MCRKIREKSFIKDIGEDCGISDFQESKEFETKEDPEELVLNLENYVQIPKALISRTKEVTETFNADFFSMIPHLHNHPSCIIKTDIRSPLCFQYSVSNLFHQ